MIDDALISSLLTKRKDAVNAQVVDVISIYMTTKLGKIIDKNTWQ